MKQPSPQRRAGSMPELLRCAKCRYEWTPKVPDPKECPQCKSRYWQERIAKE